MHHCVLEFTSRNLMLKHLYSQHDADGEGHRLRQQVDKDHGPSMVPEHGPKKAFWDHAPLSGGQKSRGFIESVFCAPNENSGFRGAWSAGATDDVEKDWIEAEGSINDAASGLMTAAPRKSGTCRSRQFRQSRAALRAAESVCYRPTRRMPSCVMSRMSRRSQRCTGSSA